MNLMNNEVELNYTKTKLIQIEEGETCRIPIPVDRCPVSTFEQVEITREKDIVDFEIQYSDANFRFRFAVFQR